MHPEMEPNYSKQRLIFRPKSLLLGWWEECIPPIPPLNPPLPGMMAYMQVATNVFGTLELAQPITAQSSIAEPASRNAQISINKKITVLSSEHLLQIFLGSQRYILFSYVLHRFS